MKPLPRPTRTSARKRPPPGPPGPRRRPQQARARHTARALREAFVRVLVERGYAGVTVREVTLVAGTALGSFYDYYASMDDLARVSLHLRSKALLLALRGAAGRHAGMPLAQIVVAVVDAMLARHRERPREWAAHYLLERHFSSLEAYLEMYERFVDAWAEAIGAATDWPAHQPPREAARVAQAILYGLFANQHLTHPDGPDNAALRRMASEAIDAYLHAARR